MLFWGDSECLSYSRYVRNLCAFSYRILSPRRIVAPSDASRSIAFGIASQTDTVPLGKNRMKCRDLVSMVGVLWPSMGKA